MVDFTARAAIIETLEEKAATCTEAGYAKYNLRIQSDKFSENYIELTRDFAAKKHIVSQFPQYGEGILPSYNLSANEVYCDLTCDECGDTFKHTYIGKVYVEREPTCEERGNLVVEWSVNADVIRVNGTTYGGVGYRDIAAEGHIYDNEETPDVCSRCETHKSLMGSDWWKDEETGIHGIEKLTIQKEIPEEGAYLKAWNIDRDDAGYLKAYLVDEHTVVLSTMGADYLYLNTNGYFLDNFASLTTIEGFDLVNVDNCTSLEGTFKNCSALTSLDLSTWTTKNEKVTLRHTFINCASLVTILANKEYVDKLVAPTDLVQGEKDDTFSNCTKLVGTVTTADGEEVTAYNANNVGGAAARVYLTYSTIVEG
jgi:surface protein